jgi:hypothetical protein
VHVRLQAEGTSSSLLRCKDANGHAIASAHKWKRQHKWTLPVKCFAMKPCTSCVSSWAGTLTAPLTWPPSKSCTHTTGLAVTWRRVDGVWTIQTHAYHTRNTHAAMATACMTATHVIADIQHHDARRRSCACLICSCCCRRRCLLPERSGQLYRLHVAHLRGGHSRLRQPAAWKCATASSSYTPQAVTNIAQSAAEWARPWTEYANGIRWRSTSGFTVATAGANPGLACQT